jgi:uncharacterized protein YndB with AHSA1/START domain
MPTYEASISIAAPRESVWRVLADVAAWPQWLPTVTSVQALDGDPLKLGSRYTVHQPKLRPATWVVTELKPPHSFVWRARTPGLLMIATHAIEKDPTSGSRVTLRFEFVGLLGAPLGWLFRSITERYLAQEAASLKLTVEGRQ